MTKPPNSLPPAGPRKANVPSRPSGIRGKQGADVTKGNFARIASVIGINEDAVSTALVTRMLADLKVKPDPSGKFTADEILAALGTRSPAEWAQWFQQKGIETGGAAKPLPPGVPVDGGEPIKGKVNFDKPASAPEADTAANTLRQRLIELGVKPDQASKIPDSDLADQVAELEKVTAEAQAKAGQSEDAQRAARKDQKRAENLEDARRRNSREPKPPKPPKAAAVTTAGEKPVTKNVDTNTPSGGAKDLAALSSEDLYQLARKRQVEEGMGSRIVVGGPNAGATKLPTAADIAAADGPIEVRPGSAGPTAAADDLPMLEPADPNDVPPTRVQATAGNQTTQVQGTPQEEPFFKPAYNPFGTTKGKDNFGRALARNLPSIAIYGGIPTGIGLGTYYGLSGGQSHSQDELDNALQKAVAAQQWLQQKFGTYKDRPPVRQQPDMPQSPEDTIRSLRGTR